MMARDYSRVKRGMVFWYDSTKSYNLGSTYQTFNGKGYTTSVQRGYRPYLVVSNNLGNNSSPTCNVVPITTEEKTNLPVHVKFFYAGRTQTIMVEQITTVDILALEDYSYTVSDDVMRKVERALMTQFDLRPTVTYTDLKLDNILKHLEGVVSNTISERLKVIHEQQEGINEKAIEDTALKLGQMIEDLCKPSEHPVTPKQETPKQETKQQQDIIIHNQGVTNKNFKYSGMTAVEKFNAKYNRSDNTPVEKKTENIKEIKEPVKSSQRSKRNTWTIETRQQYLDDCEKCHHKRL